MSRILIAEDIESHRAVRLEWCDEGKCQTTWTDATPSPGTYFAPGLIDLQVNGFAGIDFQSATPLTREDLMTACCGLHEAGCSQFLLTLITDDWNALLDRLLQLRKVRESDPVLKRGIVGWHIEGPFLSDRPGFHGAHNPEQMQDPSARLIEDLRRATGDDPVLLTLAPERQGAIESIRAATAMGMRVSLGHTDASSECLADAVRAGATGFTHLGNGCPQLLDRHDNILWRVLDQPALSIGLIPDTHHLPPTAFRVIHRAAGEGRILYVTDAMSAAGAPPGRYRLKDQELEVGTDQVVRRPGTSQFAGSALRPVDGVFRAASMLRESWQTCWLRFSRTPSNWMQWKSPTTTTPRSEGCLITTTAEGQLQSLKMIYFRQAPKLVATK